MAEKKAKVATATKKAEATKKTTAKKTVAKKAAVKVVEINPINVGYKAGNVYQALAKAEKALTVAEIAKAAGISAEETYMGIGWLFKEGKIAAKDNKLVLA